MPHFAFALTPQIALLIHWVARLIYCGYGARYLYRFARPRLAYLIDLKQTYRQWHEVKLSCYPCDFGAVEALRKSKIALFTQNMEASGFVSLGDYALHDASVNAQLHAPPPPPLAAPVASQPPARRRYYSVVYARVFVHPTHGCFGTIAYTVTKDARKPEWISFAFSIDILSLSGHEERDWLYNTALVAAGKKQIPSRILFRHPRQLNTRMTKVTLPKLLEKHLQRRAEIARVAKVSWRRDLSMRDFIGTNENAFARIRNLSRQMTLAQTAWNLFLLQREVKKERDNAEWLGELEGRL